MNHTPKSPKSTNQAGFTLIEMLVTLAIGGVVLLLVSMTFLNSVRTTNRTNLQLQLKQQGDFAMSEMLAMIRRASAIELCTNSSITIINQDGGSSTFALVEDQADQPRIASNSSFLTGTDTLVDQFLVECSTTGEDITFASVQFHLTRSGDLIEQPISRMFTGSASIRRLN